MSPSDFDSALGESANGGLALDRLVELIQREQYRKAFAAVRSLWRIGDGVRRLKRDVGPRLWRTVLRQCAGQVGMHASSLEEAARVAEAFNGAQRAELRKSFRRSKSELTPSHLIVLARAPQKKRERGIEALLLKRYSIRELREYLRRAGA